MSREASAVEGGRGGGGPEGGQGGETGPGAVYMPFVVMEVHFSWIFLDLDRNLIEI